LIGTVGDQQVIAGREHRQQRGRDRGETRWQQRDAGAVGPFERAQGAFQRFRGRRAAAAVEVARASREEILGARIKDGGDVVNRRIDEAMIGRGVAAAHDEPCRRPQRRMRRVGFGLLGHDSVLGAGRAVSGPRAPRLGAPTMPQDCLMTVHDVTVNPLTPVHDRSQIRADHSGAGACGRTGRAPPLVWWRAR
jgi:hypothetical protein